MRCPNCGWKNTPDKTSCFQCQTPLQPNTDAQAGGLGGDADYQNASSGSNSAANTIRGDQPNLTAWDETGGPDAKSGNRHTSKKEGESSDSRAMRVCKCGYHNVADAISCVKCGSQLGYSEEQSRQEKQQEKPQEKHHHSGVGTQTINPWSNKKRASFRLNLIAREGEDMASERAYNGEVVNLNRANLEPDNPTITSHVQAVVEFRNGEWYLVNQSTMKTTFIRVGDEPVKLKSGDMLLLGDRLFKFDC